MDARLIPLVLPTVKKINKLKQLKEEFKRIDTILNFKYPEEDESEDSKRLRKSMTRYMERLADSIIKLEKELYES